ncbi:MAG: hypothetical protein ACE5J5_02285 [Candidatus Hydrothermarchaeales archaeon]
MKEGKKSSYSVKSAKHDKGLSKSGRVRVDHIVDKNRKFLKKLAEY